jgi:peptidoglycan/xylan/chitin deacetylase (PgdA/CDA1 family)
MVYSPLLSCTRTSIAYDVEIGTLISDCVVEGTIALAFDDGPWVYTSQLLDVLESYNVTATFFVVGNSLGKGHIDDPSTPWPAILQRMHGAGHQIASHSWTHQDLTQINSTLQQAQVIYNEMAFRNLFGWFPTYFRCPYLDCTVASGCFDLLNNLGYHIINMDIDTLDYMNDAADLIQNSRNIFSNDVSSDSAHNSYIPLTHDIHYQTVINLTAFMIDTLFARGYKPVTVGECLDDPPANWYRDASGTISGNTTSSSSSSSSISIDPSTSTSTSTSTFSSTISSSAASVSISSSKHAKTVGIASLKKWVIIGVICLYSSSFI